jgi:N-acetylmuramoyl-L-alanine amidase
VTHGQLKEVARHFFDRLQAELYYPTGQSYPWAAPGAQPAADYAMANLGHAKSLFQFDLATDSDQDGIPDWWEKAHGLNHKNRNDALATSAGGRMTNLAAYRNHLDPADASAPVASSLAPSDPPVVITLRSSRLNNSTTDSSSAFIDIDPGSPPLIKNGDFEEGAENRLPSGSSDFRKWYVGEGPSPITSGGWEAIGGDQAVSSTDPNAPGSRANHLQWEVQQQLNDYTLPSRYSTRSGMLNQYVELDAHWERVADGNPIQNNFGSNPTKDGKSDRNKESDHGIKQTVSLSRGNYLLLFDYRGRVRSDSNQFKVSAKGERAVDVETDLIAEKDASDPITGESPTGLQKWKQGSVSFSVSGGNPADIAELPVILKFDLVLAPGKKADSFGVFIDNVILLPIAVVELSPKTMDEDGNDIVGSEKPYSGKPLTPFVEVNPDMNKVAHREIKVLIGSSMKDKRVTWTLEPVPGATPATIRGNWSGSPVAAHKNCFEESSAYGKNGFVLSGTGENAKGKTTVGADGHTAIRVNVPAIGFNQARIKIQIEGMSTPMDLIDMEVPGVVVIDPGHGGTDSGTPGSDPTVLEKDLVLPYGLDLRQKVIDKFTVEKHGLRIFMTRKTDVKIDNALRAALAKNVGADVFLSIHFNAPGEDSDSTTVRGTEYITRSTGQVNAAEDASLGGDVQSVTLAAVLASDTAAKHRDPKSGRYAVLSDSTYGNTTEYHPIRGTIIEVEFITHPTALKTVRLTNPTGAAVKAKFAADVSTVIYNNIRNHQ